MQDQDNGSAAAGGAEASQWARFSQRLLAADSYLFAEALAWTLGPDGLDAVISALRRAEKLTDARDRFACTEAAAILVGAREDWSEVLCSRRTWALDDHRPVVSTPGGRTR